MTKFSISYPLLFAVGRLVVSAIFTFDQLMIDRVREAWKRFEFVFERTASVLWIAIGGQFPGSGIVAR